jgi:hypothetical protein
MRVKRTIVVLLSLLFLTVTVNAYYANPGPGATHFLNPIGPDEQWIIAGIGQQNIITLIAYNDTVGYAGPVKNAVVTFYVDDISLGSVTPQTVTTDVSGRAVTVFAVNSTHPKSGTARITAVVQSADPSKAVYQTPTIFWDQKIDHNTPDAADFSYDLYGGVASLFPVNIVVMDKWGNLIDNKRPGPAHNLTLHVNGPSPPNNCGFTDFGLAHDHEFSLDPDGEVALNITSTTKPGWHYILMDPMGNMPEQMKLFNALSSGIPFSITQTYSPDGDPYPTVIADGTDKFVFYYTLYDKYGNPTTGQDILVTITSLDLDEGAPQQLTLTSGVNGQNWSGFGPKSTTNRYLISATTAGNRTIWANKTVRFYSPAPSNIDVQANPQSMPSRDSDPQIFSVISVKVVDMMGNGVGGEDVTIAITNTIKNPTDATITQPASFSKTGTVTSASATTDVNGYATFTYYPGAFTKLGTAGYREAATGTTTITATWNGNQRDVKVVWKNYPYLSAVVSVYPPQVHVGNTVNVSIKLNGDGWALYHYPVDVDLVMDRSTSMTEAITSTDRSTKISVAKIAAKNFVHNMSESTDRVGLFSFSDANSADPEHSASHNALLSSTFLASTSPINTAITNLNANGKTALRPAVKQAIDDLAANKAGNANAVRAVVVMTDGDWNDEGSPNGHGTGWPVDNPDASLSNSGNIIANDYRYYSDLPDPKGTLTPYPTTECSQYSTTQCDLFANTCDVCRTGYTLDSRGRCCITTGSGKNKKTTCNYPNNNNPSWCSQKSCDTWHCNVYATEYKSTDGEFTNQNLSVYAKNNGIRLYFIFFTGTPGSTTTTTLSTMANATGGFYQQATTATDLYNAYTKIAGDLKTVAAVDTTASLDFSNLIVNNQVPADFTTNPYFEYIGDPIVAAPRKGIDLPALQPGSTMLDKYILNEDGSIKQHFSPGSDDSNNPFTNTGPIIINQTNYWNTAPHKQQLHFNISTVGQNETWEADFRLKVLREGDILIFGPASRIGFTNGMAGASSMTLPNLSLSSSMNPNDPGLELSSIDIFNLARRDSGMVKGTLPVAWTMTYTGAAADTITEEVSYIRDNDPPVRFAILTGRASDLAGPLQTATLNTEKLPPGGYTIQVHAYAKYASVTRDCGPYTYTTQGRSFIHLE